jgi:hypothetical protein
MEGPPASPGDDYFADLLAAIARFRSRDKTGRKAADLAQEVIKLRQACDLLQEEFDEAAAAFSEAEKEEGWEPPTPIK